jgi:hypothetical protein
MRSNSISRVVFFALAGTQTAQIQGDHISGVLKAPLPEFFGIPEGFLVQEFVNWPDRPQDILRFTKRYGPLSEGPSSGSPFRFTLKSWRAAQQSLRGTWELFALHQTQKFDQSTSIIEVDSREHFIWKKGRLEYRAWNLLRLLQLELASIPMERVKVCKCGRPDCPQRYFVAHHLGQSYGTAPCAIAAQRKWKQAWWEEHGEEWRRAGARRGRKSSERGKP